MITTKIKSITKKHNRKVYDVIGMPNGNFVCNHTVISNCDEAIRFACVPGWTEIKTENGLIEIKELEGKKDFKVYTYNEKTKKEELQTAKTCIKVKTDVIYEVETEDGKKIQATKEHKFLTINGWKMLSELKINNILINNSKIKSIKKLESVEVYDIIGVKKNKNYIANDFVVHNSSADWNKKENKELKKKLAQVRTKHLLFILCFPLKIYKLEKTYLESYVNYWIDLFGRGRGAVYVRDKNPVMDSWRMNDFKKIGSYTEFTDLTKVEKTLKKHPNFWQIIKFPKPPDWLYTRYLNVREKNIYDDDNVLANVSKEDIHKGLLILALRDIMLNDSTLTMNRVILHVSNEYDIKISKAMVQAAVEDSKQLIIKIREQALNS